MRYRNVKLPVLCLSTILAFGGVSAFAYAEETQEAVKETEAIDITFEMMAEAAAQGYDGEDLQNDIYKEQDPSFLKESAPETEKEQTAETLEETSEKAEETAEEMQENAAEEVQEESTEEENETEVKDNAASDQEWFDTRDIFEKSEFTVGVVFHGDIEGIHVEPSKESELEGILKPYGFVMLYGEAEDGWYEAQSGNIYGYVDASVIVTGEEARQIAEEVVYESATPYEDGAKVFAGPSEEEEVILTLNKYEEIETLDDEGDWITVYTPDQTVGYMKSADVAVRKFYPGAMTLDEYTEWEKAREEIVEETEEEAEETYEEPAETQQKSQYQQQQYQQQQYQQTPQTEAPQTEAPQTEAPQTEAPQTEAPQTEAPQTEAPQTEAPQTEAPADQTAAETTETTAPAAETAATADDSGEIADDTVVNDGDDGSDEEYYDDTTASDSGEVYEDGEVYEE